MTCEVAKQLLGLISSPTNGNTPPNPVAFHTKAANCFPTFEAIPGNAKEGFPSCDFGSQPPLIKSMGKGKESQPPWAVALENCPNELCLRWPQCGFDHSDESAQRFCVLPSSSFSSFFPAQPAVKQCWLPGSRLRGSKVWDKGVFCIRNTLPLPHLPSGSQAACFLILAPTPSSSVALDLFPDSPSLSSFVRLPGLRSSTITY